jgi:hypothetical protein
MVLLVGCNPQLTERREDAMRWSNPGWWEEPLRVELAEIMDDLDPGWSAWRNRPEPVAAR